MNKKYVQKRVSQNGKPLALSKFNWDEKARTFSTTENNLVIDFLGISDCTFNTGGGCTFNTSGGSVIVRRDIFEVIQPKNDEVIRLCPYNISGYLTQKGEAWYNDKDEECIVADGILSKVISKRRGVYRVLNHGASTESYLLKKGGVYSHGATLKEAKESLRYKLVDKDTSAYDNYTLDTKLSVDDCIKMYRTITGACAQGVRQFVEASKVKETYTIGEIITLTNRQYGNSDLEQFFRKEI